MPKVRCLTHYIRPNRAPVIDRLVVARDDILIDDLDDVIVESVDEAVDLLRWQEPSPNGIGRRFRVVDWPWWTLAWQTVSPTSALVFQARGDQVERVHVLLGGVDEHDDRAAVAVAKRVVGPDWVDGLMDPECSSGLVTHVALIRRPIKDGGDADLLGMLAIVPIFCELSGIT